MVALIYIAASALLAITSVLADSSGSPTHLFARQISGFDPSSIPSSCLQSQCEDLINVFSANNACTTLDCICTNSVASALQKCLQCEGSSGIAGVNATSVQQSLTDFEQGCSEAGHPVSTSGSGSSGSSGSSSTGSSGISSTGSSASSSSGSTSASGSTATGGSSTTQKSNAVVGLGISIFGSVAAFALSSANVL